MATLVHLPLPASSAGAFSTLKLQAPSNARSLLLPRAAPFASNFHGAVGWDASLATSRSTLLTKQTRLRGFVKAAAADDIASDTVSTKQKVSTEVLDKSLGLLKETAATKKVPKKDILDAILKIKKAQVDIPDFLQKLGGTKSPGRSWELVFTTNAKQVTEARKGGEGGGTYFPVTAVQNFDAEALKISNGVFFGDFGSFVFYGHFVWKGRTLPFLFDSVEVKLGPLGPLSFNIASEEQRNRTPEVKSDPFFNFFYVDDDILVGQGRSGGMAFWKSKA